MSLIIPNSPELGGLEPSSDTQLTVTTIKRNTLNPVARKNSFSIPNDHNNNQLLESNARGNLKTVQEHPVTRKGRQWKKIKNLTKLTNELATNNDRPNRSKSFISNKLPAKNLNERRGSLPIDSLSHAAIDISYNDYIELEQQEMEKIYKESQSKSQEMMLADHSTKMKSMRKNNAKKSENFQASHSDDSDMEEFLRKIGPAKVVSSKNHVNSVAKKPSSLPSTAKNPPVYDKQVKSSENSKDSLKPERAARSASMSNVNTPYASKPSPKKHTFPEQKKTPTSSKNAATVKKSYDIIESRRDAMPIINPFDTPDTNTNSANFADNSTEDVVLEWERSRRNIEETNTNESQSARSRSGSVSSIFKALSKRKSRSKSLLAASAREAAKEATSESSNSKQDLKSGRRGSLPMTSVINDAISKPSQEQNSVSNGSFSNLLRSRSARFKDIPPTTPIDSTTEDSVEHSLKKLAIAKGKEGMWEEATNLLLSVIKIQKGNAQINHAKVAGTQFYLANAYHRIGKTDEAFSLLQEAKDVLIREESKECLIDLAAVLLLIAVIEEERGNIISAINYVRQTQKAEVQAIGYRSKASIKKYEKLERSQSQKHDKLERSQSLKVKFTRTSSNRAF